MTSPSAVLIALIKATGDDLKLELLGENKLAGRAGQR